MQARLKSIKLTVFACFLCDGDLRLELLNFVLEPAYVSGIGSSVAFNHSKWCQSWGRNRRVGLRRLRNHRDSTSCLLVSSHLDEAEVTVLEGFQFVVFESLVVRLQKQLVFLALEGLSRQAI